MTEINEKEDLLLLDKQSASRSTPARARLLRLYLDSGTLTPVLNKLESFGYIERHRSTEDERVVIAILTEKGQSLKEQARQVPEQMSCHLTDQGVTFTPDEVTALKGEHYKILNGLK